MAEHEDKNKSEAEVKKSYQATLIPEGQDENSEIKELSDITSGEPAEDPELKEDVESDTDFEEPDDEEPVRSGVNPILIDDEMKRSYISYAMSVIVGRALPDARDGLKPVHRRILFSMNENGLQPNRPFRKSAF